ncbi:MAG: hypothetical protein LUD47_06225 [Clostridia bacterium]|nr:hypothetical protein [Clostridia bacterium]
MDTNTIIIIVSVAVIIAVVIFVVARVFIVVRRNRKTVAVKSALTKGDRERVYELRRQCGVPTGLPLDFFSLDTSVASMVEIRNLVIDETAGKIYTFLAVREDGIEKPTESFVTDLDKVSDCVVLVNNKTATTIGNASSGRGMRADEIYEYLVRFTNVSTLSVSIAFDESEERTPFYFPFLSSSSVNYTDAVSAAQSVFLAIYRAISDKMETR